MGSCNSQKSVEETIAKVEPGVAFCGKCEKRTNSRLVNVYLTKYLMLKDKKLKWFSEKKIFTPKDSTT
jgi:hypothetical protein